MEKKLQPPKCSDFPNGRLRIVNFANSSTDIKNAGNDFVHLWNLIIFLCNYRNKIGQKISIFWRKTKGVVEELLGVWKRNKRLEKRQEAVWKQTRRSWSGVNNYYVWNSFSLIILEHVSATQLALINFRIYIYFF